MDLDKERISPVAEGDAVRPVAGVRRLATRSASSCTAASPSWCRSAPSCRWATASRVWCTSREMAVHHVDLPEQVVTPGEELWVKIIDIDLQRRRISPVDQAGGRGRRGLRGVPRGLRRARLRRAGQLHRLRLRRGRVHPRDRGAGGVGRLRHRGRDAGAPARGGGRRGRSGGRGRRDSCGGRGRGCSCSYSRGGRGSCCRG